MEVAPRSKLLTLFTLFTLFMLFKLLPPLILFSPFRLFTLLIHCLNSGVYAYIVWLERHWNNAMWLLEQNVG